MTAETARSRKNIIDAVITSAKKHFAAAQLPLLTTFIQQYFSNVPLEDLDSRTTESLYGMVTTHWNVIYHRQPNESKIKVFNPNEKEHGWHSSYTVIEVNQLDMAFLVDSIRMELNRLGYSTNLIIQLGGMQVRRNAKGQITKILPFESKAEEDEIEIEASIYLEIDKETDSTKLVAIEENLQRVLKDVAVVVSDWETMRSRIFDAIAELDKEELPLDHAEIDEAKAFLHWLVNDHYTLLGYRDYNLTVRDKETVLEIVPNSGLGVLRDESKSKATRKLSELPTAAREQALSKDILIISKTNTRSTVHRPVYTDYVGVKRFNNKGEIIGERRFIGLYTSDAYHDNPQDIPLLRRKVALILKKSGVLHHGHAAKALMNILETFPRDDLFQGSIDELTEMALGIWHLQERRKIRLFIRRDAYHRYVSCLVYLPREKFNTNLINRMQEVLVENLEGTEVIYSTFFPESILARIHYVIRTDPKKRKIFNAKTIEEKLVVVGQSWYDRVHQRMIEKFGDEEGETLFRLYRQAFPAGYREAFKSSSVLWDIKHIEELRTSTDLAMTFYRPKNSDPGVLRLKTYRYDENIPLSDVIPTLEFMGLRVLSEQPYQLQVGDRSVWLNDFLMYYPETHPIDVERIKGSFQEAFYRVWQGISGNDSFNRLVLAAELTWREVGVLRAYAKYLHQARFLFSQHYIELAFTNNPGIARLIIEFFHEHFNPELEKGRSSRLIQIEKSIVAALDNVTSLDEERIFSRYVALIKATLRTNYYQKTVQGDHKAYISFKLNPSLIPDLPLPLPMFETYVYSARFEGLHLRSSKVARGGIRWSDRREDYRTEVLGLMKAQQVKNAIIVPSGAKGGFYPKQLPIDGTREEIMQEGIACYQNFIRGLLDLVDNLVDGKISTPPHTVRYDDDDPYLVVAADKGTATFSDIANAISAEYYFWLGDAFASGGSAGYDHKKMGITARGAWESVKSHFQELGLDTQKESFTVVGIGDMSGDVFGNGMLLSQHIKLVGAFNHMHIFLDPNPKDTQASFEERMRLFNLPRSQWTDYNAELISKGGGIFMRSAKAVKLSDEVRILLDTDTEVVEPNELIRLMLKSKVDLLWNGGIGTYVKASTETDTQVGDRANDALRINGSDLRCRVVAEGGNLGFTQNARIEYELTGGRINTDFIDNSGGVDCSDHEVNIKILLDRIVAKGKLTLSQRNKLMASMTDEVGELVLFNNYRQAGAISLAVKQSAEYLELYRQYMDAYEEKGRLPRSLEFLPDNKTLNDRKADGHGLTRPEIAVLMAYSKIILKEQILATDLTKDPSLADYMESAFPKPLNSRYREEMDHHHLSREIIATQLCNDLVTNLGVTFTYQMQDETGGSAESVVRAYVASREIFGMAEYLKSIQSLEHKVSADVLHNMTLDVSQLIRRATRWFLRNRHGQFNILETINHFKKPFQKLVEAMPELLTGQAKVDYQNRAASLVKSGVPRAIAQQFAVTREIFSLLNIVEAAEGHKTDITTIAALHFMLIDRLDLIWFREQINAYPITNHWAVLARAAFKADLDSLLRAITVSAIAGHTKNLDIEQQLSRWFTKNAEQVARWESMVADLRSSTTNEFSMLTVAMRELVDLARTNGVEVVK
jgi:glutamate dehydrogenase